MDSLSVYSAILLGLYALTLLTLAVWSYFKEDHAGYVIGGRNIGFFASASSMLAGQFNGGGVFFLVTFAILSGYGSMSFSAGGFLLGYIVIAVLARRVREDAEKYDDVNVPDIVHRYIGKLTGHFSSFIIIGKALLFGTAQLLIAGSVVAAVFGLEKVWGIGATAALIAIYMILGGYLTVIRTDILQWGFLLFVVIAAAFFYPFPSVSTVINDVIGAGTMTTLGYALFTFMLILSNADVWQRVMSAKNVRTARKSLITSGLLFSVFWFFGLVITTSWATQIDVKYDFFALFNDRLLSPITLSILGVFTLTAVMSTIDTQVYLFTSAIAKNLMKLNLATSRIRYVRVTRYLTLGLLLFMAIAASFAGGTLQFVLKAFSFAYILAPIIVLALIWKEQSKTKDILCFISLSIGLAVYLIMYAQDLFSEMIYFCIPAGITSLLCFGGYSFAKLLPQK